METIALECQLPGGGSGSILTRSWVQNTDSKEGSGSVRMNHAGLSDTLMCKHIINAQVSIRAQCCKRWFDCAECHDEVSPHELIKTNEMVFACKKCKKVFRKDMTDYEEEDEFCPHCDNQYVIEAITPEARLGIETGDLRKDARVIKDDRQKAKKAITSIYDVDASGIMG